ncbi:hypothetical protein GCM10010156_33700 [Planobispora rosea]|uniref:Lipoprotein n=1 Tax=Planobispora rosea TaxID=35762 RepID=A0A8J3WCS0_PLARO|nr:hypothetical protein [Planobispora rosea]GGS72122.1 hypothetical protein GCM10010156_33700 [Planobispora rosea]GIH85234.1 hypothetical protein Pro02_36420 [Planobispora rosea]
MKIVTVAALVLAVTGCRFGQTARDVPKEQVELTSSGSKAPAAESTAPPDKVVAGREGALDNHRFRVEIVQFLRRDRFVNLTFTVTVTKGDGGLGWQVNNAFSAVPQQHPTVDGVFLVDTRNAKKHLVALDSDNACVCSRIGSLFLKEGESAAFSATFAAPPEGVTSMDVHIPNVGTLADVPLG